MALGIPFSIDYPDFEEFGATPCSQVDPELFFPEELVEGASSPNKLFYRYEYEAKLVCSSCPYQMRCLEYALRHPEELGIWGGTTENDRRKIKRGLARPLKIMPIKHN